MHKLTSKRQVTLPKAVCLALGLEAGDMIEVFARDGVAHLVRMSDESLAGRFATLTKGKPMPGTDEFKRSIKARAATKFVGPDDLG